MEDPDNVYLQSWGELQVVYHHTGVAPTGDPHHAQA